jgi:sugar-specific transcriptional regulator TrmB
MSNAASVDQCLESLSAFGFTELEARTYLFLLGESPATGYRVAQAVGKPVANTYKALASLRDKGAVVAEDGGGLCRAVPAEELLGQLERRFQEHRTRAGRALARLGAGAGDARVYQLRTPAQVLERCRRALAGCRRVAVIDAFPAALEELRPAAEAAAARGVAVAVKAYRPAAVAGADVVVHPGGEAVLRRWPGQWLNLVADSREYVLAFLTEDGAAVRQAVWTGSAYLAAVYHSAVACEVTLSALERQVAEGAPPRALRGTLRRFRYLFESDVLPGYQELARQFGGPRPAAPHRILKPKRNGAP